MGPGTLQPAGPAQGRLRPRRRGCAWRQERRSSGAPQITSEKVCSLSTLPHPSFPSPSAAPLPLNTGDPGWQMMSICSAPPPSSSSPRPAPDTRVTVTRLGLPLKLCAHTVRTHSHSTGLELELTLLSPLRLLGASTRPAAVSSQTP